MNERKIAQKIHIESCKKEKDIIYERKRNEKQL